jgi:putative multiple sugar transport system permease protein
MERANKLKKGYEAESMLSLLVKCVLSVAAIMLFA